MEAATASGGPLLVRDGAFPATPRVTPTAIAADSQPIDGVTRCACCDRFPLVGEQVVRHAGRKGAGWVCSTCESSGRGERLGEVVTSARMRSLGGAMNVRRAV